MIMLLANWDLIRDHARMIGPFAMKLVGHDMQWDTFIYQDKASFEVVAQAQRAASGAANIVIEGAPGTGKTTLAHAMAYAIHSRAGGDSALISHYCTDDSNPVPDYLASAENGAVLFLYEVAQLSARAQAEIAMVSRSAGDVRVISASARDLAEAVRAGTFREDLFYQLAVVPLHLPPLAQRPADIPMLARHFASRFAYYLERPAFELTRDAIAKLSSYHWPGNVRELENVMHRAVLFTEGQIIGPDDLSFGGSQSAQGETVSAALVGCTVAEVERDLILQTLRHCGGNRTRAADILGISVRTLRNKIRLYGEGDDTCAPGFSRAA